jgi:hypothetical protein
VAEDSRLMDRQAGWHSRLWAWVPLFAFLITGLFFAFRVTLLSGFAHIQAEPGDNRLFQYILEHSYLWITGDPHHAKYWNEPFLYPEVNVTAFNDILLGTAPIYWVFRSLGFLADTSMQLWLITLSILNFGVAYAFLRKVFRVDSLPGSVGAFFFAFASPRICQLTHLQLSPHFWTILALWAVIEVFSDERRADGREKYWIGLFFASWVLQFYSGFYLGWFLTFTLYLALIVSLFNSQSRSAVVRFIRKFWGSLLIGGVLGGIALWPMASHCLKAAHLIGMKQFDEVKLYSPTLPTWFYLGPSSWLYGWAEKIRYFSRLSASGERRLGIGLISSAIVFWTLYQNRKLPIFRYFWIVGVLIVLLSTQITQSYSWVWWLVGYRGFPAGASIRTLSRIGLMLLIPAMVAIAVFFQKNRGKGAFILIALVTLEQGQWLSYFDKSANREAIDSIQQSIPAHCKSFYLVALPDPEHPHVQDLLQLDALLASEQSGIPTMNGYSGTYPPGWTELEAQPTHEAVSAWLDRYGRKSELQDACVIPIQLKPIPTSFEHSEAALST